MLMPSGLFVWPAIVDNQRCNYDKEHETYSYKHVYMLHTYWSTLIWWCALTKIVKLNHCQPRCQFIAVYLS